MTNYWHALRDHKRPVRFVAARLLMSVNACRLFTIEQRGYRIRFHNANLSSQLWIDPHERDDALSFFREYLREGDRVVDVGANIGDTVLTASVCVGATGSVVGVEPHPRTFEFLQDNIRLNGVTNVRLVNSAVGSAPGRVRFSNDRRDDMNRVNGGDLEVPIDRLDALVADSAPIALLKIDVEGYEKFVLEGAGGTVRRSSCVLFEVSARHFERFGYTTRDVIRILETAGFRVFRVRTPRALEPVPDVFEPDRFEDLVALRDPGDFTARTGWSIA